MSTKEQPENAAQIRKTAQSLIPNTWLARAFYKLAGVPKKDIEKWKESADLFKKAAELYTEIHCPRSAIDCWHERAFVSKNLELPMEAIDSLLKSGLLMPPGKEHFNTMKEVATLYEREGLFKMAADALCAGIPERNVDADYALESFLKALTLYSKDGHRLDEICVVRRIMRCLTQSRFGVKKNNYARLDEMVKSNDINVKKIFQIVRDTPK